MERLCAMQPPRPPCAVAPEVEGIERDEREIMRDDQPHQLGIGLARPASVAHAGRIVVTCPNRLMHQRGRQALVDQEAQDHGASAVSMRGATGSVAK